MTPAEVVTWARTVRLQCDALAATQASPPGVPAFTTERMRKHRNRVIMAGLRVAEALRNHGDAASEGSVSAAIALRIAVNHSGAAARMAKLAAAIEAARQSPERQRRIAAFRRALAEGKAASRYEPPPRDLMGLAVELRMAQQGMLAGNHDAAAAVAAHMPALTNDSAGQQRREVLRAIARMAPDVTPEQIANRVSGEGRE